MTPDGPLKEVVMRNLLIAGALLAAVGPQAALAAKGYAVKAPAEQSAQKADDKGVADEKATAWKQAMAKKEAVADQVAMEAKKVSANHYPTYRVGDRTFTKVKTVAGPKSAD